MLWNTLFYLLYLEISEKAVPLHCVFHSIRFKVNKGWSTAVLLFLCPYVNTRQIMMPIHSIQLLFIHLKIDHKFLFLTFLRIKLIHETDSNNMKDV